MSVWIDIEGDVRRILSNPGFVEISRHRELAEPWAIGLQFDEKVPTTWFSAKSLPSVLSQATCGIEELGRQRDDPGLEDICSLE